MCELASWWWPANRSRFLLTSRTNATNVKRNALWTSRVMYHLGVYQTTSGVPLGIWAVCLKACNQEAFVRWFCKLSGGTPYQASLCLYAVKEWYETHIMWSWCHQGVVRDAHYVILTSPRSGTRRTSCDSDVIKELYETHIMWFWRHQGVVRDAHHVILTSSRSCTRRTSCDSDVTKEWFETHIMWFWRHQGVVRDAHHVILMSPRSCTRRTSCDSDVIKKWYETHIMWFWRHQGVVRYAHHVILTSSKSGTRRTSCDSGVICHLSMHSNRLQLDGATTTTEDNATHWACAQTGQTSTGWHDDWSQHNSTLSWTCFIIMLDHTRRYIADSRVLCLAHCVDRRDLKVAWLLQFISLEHGNSARNGTIQLAIYYHLKGHLKNTILSACCHLCSIANTHAIRCDGDNLWRVQFM